MGRRNAIADGFDALAGAARAVRAVREVTQAESRRKTIASIVASVRRIEGQLAQVEESFRAMSSFAQATVERLGQLEQKIESVYRERLAGGSGEKSCDR